jgi:hypothetical protein
MKNPMDVLKAKEQELIKVKRQIEALRLALPLLGEEGDATAALHTAPPSQKAATMS